MSFLNPFRKNRRPEGVKLAGMTSDADPQAAAGVPAPGGGAVPGERREPSLGDGMPSVPAFEEPESDADAAPPAFAFREPRVPSRENAGPAPAAASAPWDPYGVGTEASARRNPRASEPPAFSVPAAESSAPEPVRPAGMTAPQSAAAEPPARKTVPEASLPPAASGPIAMEPLTQAPAGVELPAEPAAAPEPPPMPSIPIRLRTDGKAPPRPAASERAEAEARVRTRHRYVGAAAILMAFVVAAPFVLDGSEELDGRPFSDERMAIPRESETSTTIDTAPAVRRPVSGDVDVSETTLGKSSSTARANLAREADRKERPDGTVAAGKAAPEKPEGTDPVPAERPVRRTDAAAAGRPVAAPAARSAGLVPPTGSGWYVQVLATGSEQGAERVVRRLATLGLPAWRVREGGSLWKVRVGLYGTKKEAEGAQASIILNNVAQKPYVRKQ